MEQFVKMTLAQSQKFEKTTLAQVLFYVNVSRKNADNIDLEKCLFHQVYGMSGDELGIAAMAFFKTRTKIKSCFLLNCFVRQLKREIATIHDISLSAVIKVSVVKAFKIVLF